MTTHRPEDRPRPEFVLVPVTARARSLLPIPAAIEIGLTFDAPVRPVPVAMEPREELRLAARLAEDHPQLDTGYLGGGADGSEVVRAARENAVVVVTGARPRRRAVRREWGVAHFLAGDLTGPVALVGPPARRNRGPHGRLVTTLDGSDSDCSVVDRAVRLASDLALPLHLVLVLTPDPSSDPVDPDARLRELVTGCGSVAVTAEVTEDRFGPAQGAAAVLRHHPDALLVVAVKDQPPAGRHRSVAAFLRHSPVPLLLV